MPMPPGGPGNNKDKDDKDKEKKEHKKYEQPQEPTRIGKKRRKRGPDPSHKLPTITPHMKCRLRLLKLDRIKDYLIMEEEFVNNQERLKPREEKHQEERNRIEEIRGTPLLVGSLEEIIDDTHCIVSSSMGPDYYVPIMSFVDKDLIEPGCSVLLHNKSMAVVGILQDEVDPMVSIMKVDKAPLESY